MSFLATGREPDERTLPYLVTIVECDPDSVVHLDAKTFFVEASTPPPAGVTVSERPFTYRLMLVNSARKAEKAAIAAALDGADLVDVARGAATKFDDLSTVVPHHIVQEGLWRANTTAPN
ncbi:hypothetical protein OIO90_006660, partial [Microbotryomycetes sp. JL221]